jgi:hypothetical protein
MNPEGGQRRIPDITLEQYLLGELSEKEMVETKRILDEDHESRARLAALERSNREILERYPPDFMSRQIQLRLERRHRDPSWKLLYQFRPMTALVGTAVALVLLFTVLPDDFISWRPGKDASMERIKGQGPQLKLYRKTPDGSEALEDGTRVFQGDILRIGYQAAGRAHGAVLSVDGRGTVTLHLPHQGNRSVRLKNGGQVLLDFALELDDAPRWERFYFITGNAPFDIAPVLQAANRINIESPLDRAEKLDLPKDLDQFVVSLEKGTKP